MTGLNWTIRFQDQWQAIFKIAKFVALTLAPKGMITFGWICGINIGAQRDEITFGWFSFGSQIGPKALMAFYFEVFFTNSYALLRFSLILKIKIADQR